MRYKCYLEIEKRGLISQEDKRKYNGIIRNVFKHVAEGNYSNLSKECISKDISGVEMNMILTNNDGIRQYNRKYRKLDQPTDVLSFPVVDFRRGAVDIDIDNINPENDYVALGDVVISVERMKEQALEYGHSETRELAFLVCHAMLHLLGFDHMNEADASEMESMTEEALTALGYTRDIP